jgi:hypothetical protein
MTEPIKIDRPAPQILRLLINRPEKRNAVDFETRLALIEALTAVQADPDCRAMVLGGVGGIFSAGGDLPSVLGIDEQRAAQERQARGRHHDGRKPFFCPCCRGGQSAAPRNCTAREHFQATGFKNRPRDGCRTCRRLRLGNFEPLNFFKLYPISDK